MKAFFLKLVYALLNLLSHKSSVSYIIKLKLIIGIALLSSKSVYAQKIEFPNQVNKSDTLTIDVEMEIDDFSNVMCYVSIETYPTILDEPEVIRDENAIKSILRGNSREKYQSLINLLH